MYNFDKKRFIIRVGIIAAQVMTLEEIKSREIRASKDKNREQILLLAAVCMVAIKILLVLIYPGKFSDLQNSWIKNIDNNTIYFATIVIR